LHVFGSFPQRYRQRRLSVQNRGIDFHAGIWKLGTQGSYLLESSLCRPIVLRTRPMVRMAYLLP
jgi:hypothetical protein